MCLRGIDHGVVAVENIRVELCRHNAEFAYITIPKLVADDWIDKGRISWPDKVCGQSQKVFNELISLPVLRNLLTCSLDWDQG